MSVVVRVARESASGAPGTTCDGFVAGPDQQEVTAMETTRAGRATSGIGLLGGVVFVLGAGCLYAADDESLCGEAVIQINQELTLERQAFEATMKIKDPLVGLDLSSVAITVNFADKDGNPVTATSDPNNTSALFLINWDQENTTAIEDISGNGTVGGGTEAVIKWLIVPSIGAASDINANDAPAIRMGRNDHVFRTGNTGSRKAAKPTRARQKTLVDPGDYDQALKEGLDDIRSQTGDPYEEHIEEMVKSAPRRPDGRIDWSAFKRE